jgi:chromosome segregation ATPase
MPQTSDPELSFHDAPSEFVSLEEKIYRTIELLKNAREAKAVAERDLARVREELEAREEEIDQMKAQMVTIKREREEVKARIEKMLQQMDALIAAAE